MHHHNIKSASPVELVKVATATAISEGQIKINFAKIDTLHGVSH